MPGYAGIWTGMIREAQRSALDRDQGSGIREALRASQEATGSFLSLFLSLSSADKKRALESLPAQQQTKEKSALKRALYCLQIRELRALSSRLGSSGNTTLKDTLSSVIAKINSFMLYPFRKKGSDC
jgi:phytoene dehydrogenase-like protein